jgi:hypothetical protein
MKELQTVRGITFLVDDEDYEKAKHYNWILKTDRRTDKGRVHVQTIIRDKETHKQKTFTYKKLILGINSNFTLYKNGNPLDLRRENILGFDNKTDTMKARNKIYNIYGKSDYIQSKYIGVTHKSEQLYPLCPWITAITCNGRIYSLGSFATEEDAAMAYDQKALEFFGSQARRNFPELTMEELTQKLDVIRTENKTIRTKKHAKAIQGKIVHNTKTSKHVGVSYNKEVKLWGACITSCGKRHYLEGSFYNEEDAAIAYDLKALELYGDDAKRNFPELTKEELTQKLNRIRTEKKVQNSENLSKANQGQKDRKITKTSKYMGVDWVKRLPSKNWRARIIRHKKDYSLGYFENEEDAARAYDKKAIELYGENARLNFPRK